MNTMHKSFDHGALIASEAAHGDTAGGFSEAHNSDDKTRANFVGPVIAGLVVAIMVGAAGFYIYTHYAPPPSQVVAGKNLPAPTPPMNVAPAAPPPVTATAPATPDTGPNSALARSPYSTMPVSKPGTTAKGK
jgi:hypothetical protein